uniref:Uncharacterized protein n=1 Tax=Zea mays TaxID=4577 RepID=Q36272_MAIZE|nr:unknown protein [Zea mays]
MNLDILLIKIGFLAILIVLSIQIIDEYFHKVICDPLVSISVVSCRDNLGYASHLLLQTGEIHLGGFESHLLDAWSWN